MSIFTPILRLFNVGGLSNPDRGYQTTGPQTSRTQSGTSVNDEDALKLSATWACVQIISQTVSGIPMEFKRGQNPLDKRHSLSTIFRRPNQLMKTRDFRLAMNTQLALWNNAYAQKITSGRRVVGLVPLRPGRMNPFVTDEGELEYRYSTEFGVVPFKKDEILHLKGFGTDGIVGLSRSSYARDTYGLAMSADHYAAAQFANGGRPGGVITSDKILTPKQRGQLSTLYEGISSGAIDKNKLWILEGGFKYDSLDFNADQLQMIASRMNSVSDIARYFGVPDVLIGGNQNSASAWPASFEQQMLAYLTFTVQPYLDEWEESLKDGVLDVSDRDSVTIDHDVSELIKMDSNAKANFLARNVQNGLMTRNEGRKKLKLPAHDTPGADDLTIQTNLSDLDIMSSTNGQTGNNPLPSGQNIQQ